MLRFDWNALEPGDHVLLHDDDSKALTLIDGVVETVIAARDTNDVGIRLAPDRPVVHPRRSSVHASPVDRSEPCWRCDAVARLAQPRRAAS